MTWIAALEWANQQDSIQTTGAWLSASLHKLVRKAKLLFARGSKSRELKAGTPSFSTNELILLREDPEARTSIGALESNVIAGLHSLQHVQTMASAADQQQRASVTE